MLCVSVQYEEMYNRSIQDPNGFWSDMAKEFHWDKQWDEEHINWNFDVRKGPINVEWFKGGTTNICYNALDRHVKAGMPGRSSSMQACMQPFMDVAARAVTTLEPGWRRVSGWRMQELPHVKLQKLREHDADLLHVCAVLVCVRPGRGDQACFLWEGNDLGQDRVMTYKQVLEEVCQLVSRDRAAHGLLQITGVCGVRGLGRSAQGQRGCGRSGCRTALAPGRMSDSKTTAPGTRNRGRVRTAAAAGKAGPDAMSAVRTVPAGQLPALCGCEEGRCRVHLHAYGV